MKNGDSPAGPGRCWQELPPVEHTAELRKRLWVALAALTTPQLRPTFVSEMTVDADGPNIKKLRDELGSLLCELARK